MKAISANPAFKVSWFRLMLMLVLVVGVTFLGVFFYLFFAGHHTELQVKTFTGSRFEVVHALESTGFGRKGYHILSLRDPNSGRSIRFLTIQNEVPGIKDFHLSGHQIVVDLDLGEQLTFCVTPEGKVDRQVQFFDGELHRIRRLMPDQKLVKC